jgi:anaerobic glycerol-3-phosphate dehydrogenase
MTKTVEGFYQDGYIQLSELPQGVSEQTQVLVTFLESGKLSPSHPYSAVRRRSLRMTVGQLRSLAEQLETLAGIQQGFDELNAGQTRSLADFTQEMQRKYDISS